MLIFILACKYRSNMFFFKTNQMKKAPNLKPLRSYFIMIILPQSPDFPLCIRQYKFPLYVGQD